MPLAATLFKIQSIARGVIAAGSGSAYCPSISAVIQVAA